MAVPTIQITGSVVSPDGALLMSGTITAELSQPGSALDGAVSVRVVGEISGTITNGAVPADFDLVPNDAITPAGTYYRVRIAGTTADGKIYRPTHPEKWQLASSPASIDIGAVPRIDVATSAAYSVTQAVAQSVIDAAEAARDAALVAETNAETAETNAETAQAAAEVARDAALATGKVYVSTSAGLAAEAEGAYFSVPSTVDTESLILYRKESGVAVEKKRYPSASAAVQPIWTGKKNGWPDPFFRHYDLTSKTEWGRARWFKNTTVGAFAAGWSRVAGSYFDGYAIRRDTGYNTTTLSGPAIWLDEIGAVPGDTVTAYVLVTGSSGAVYSGYRFDNGTDTSNLGAGSMLNSAGGNNVTASATPQWLRISAVVPASAQRIVLYPYNASGSYTFDLIACWAFKGAATAGPSWPSQEEEGYWRIRDTDIDTLQDRTGSPIIALPPALLLTTGREFNVYFENLTPAASADEFSWDVTTPTITSVARHENERWTYTPGGAHVAAAITIEARDKRTGEVLATASGTVKAAATSAGTGQTPKCIFIGDSLTGAGTYTQELLNIAGGGDALQIALYGTKGSGANLHEGRGGWTIDNYTSDFSDVPSGANPFWIGGAVDFPGYLTANSIPAPDYVFVMLGINDCFSQTTDAGVTALAATELAKLDTLIASIKAAGAGVQVGVMVPTPPSKDQDSFGANYYAGQSRDRFKRNIVLWAQEVITKYAGQTADRIHLVPTNVNLDTVNNMSRASATPVNSRSAITVTRQSNGVHPATDGYEQIADTVWAFLKCQY